VDNQNFILRINIYSESRHLRQAAKSYVQLKDFTWKTKIIRESALIKSKTTASYQIISSHHFSNPSYSSFSHLHDKKNNHAVKQALFLILVVRKNKKQ